MKNRENIKEAKKESTGDYFWFKTEYQEISGSIMVELKLDRLLL